MILIDKIGEITNYLFLQVFSKKTELKYYDFYGIDEIKWPGITRFKMGFAPPATPERSDGGRGGEIVKRPGTFEIPLNKIWYSLYKGIKKIKS